MIYLPTSVVCRWISNSKCNKIVIAVLMSFVPFYLLRNFQVNTPVKLTPVSITLFIVVTEDILKNREQQLASLACYAHRHSYKLITIRPNQYPTCLKMSPTFFFQKHCIALSYFLRNSQIDWIFVLDLDVIVLNMSRKIEPYLLNMNKDIKSSPKLIFYERFNGEYAAGNYLIRNHPWSHAFLLRWIEYENQITNIKFHNFDNGVLHLHLVDTVMGKVNQSMYNRCFQLYRKAIDHKTYHAFVGCCKCALGARWEFEHLRLLPRGHSYIRDNLGYAMKKRIWFPTDFLIHGQKNNLELYYSNKIDVFKCADPKWVLPIRQDAVITNYTAVKETVRHFDQEAARAYPVSVGLPDISDCWPNCTNNKTLRQKFIDKVCARNTFW